VEQEPKDLGENKKVILCIIAIPIGNFQRCSNFYN